MTQKDIAIVGGGIGGLAAAVLLARDGHRVRIYEKNSTLGGACNRLEAQGFVFDTGPTWYLMPEVYERFFSLAGARVEDHLELIDLSPSHRAYFEGRAEAIDFHPGLQNNTAAFAALDPNADKTLAHYFSRADARRRFAFEHILQGEMDTYLPYVHALMRRDAPNLGILHSLQKELGAISYSEELQAPLAAAAAFLGGSPERTPALFSFLSYAEFEQGVRYPRGGMYKIVEALVALGKSYGATYLTDSPIEKISFAQDGTAQLLFKNTQAHADIVISDADRAYTEEHLLGRTHVKATKQTPGFGAMLLFLGVGARLPELGHHTFFFSRDWKAQLRLIERGQLPHEPLLYVCAASRTDDSISPLGSEQLQVLIPLPAGKAISPEDLQAIRDRAIERMVARAPALKNNIIFEHRWEPSEFAARYHTFGGSMLGPAHTRFQSGPFRSSHRDPQFPNLYFVGSSTNPGIGIPPVLLSAEYVWRTLSSRE